MSGPADASHRADPVERALSRAAHVLPDQGPIGVFVHHNTLHAYQHLPFHEAVQKGADDLGARPYLELSEFREALRAGRIADEDVRAEIVRFLGPRSADVVLGGFTRADLWHVLLTSECDPEDPVGLQHTIRAGTAAPCAALPLWDSCTARVARGPRFPWSSDRRIRRHRDVLVTLGASDPDVPVHAELIRISAGFLDHGHAHVALPGRDSGFLSSVSRLYADGGPPPRVCIGVEADMHAVAVENPGPVSLIHAALAALGVRADEIEPYVFATALALPGWAGMFSRLERHPDEHVGPCPPTLAEFVAVRLLLERRAVEHLCRDLGVPTDWAALRACLPVPSPPPLVVDADMLFWIARAAKLSPDAVRATKDDRLAAIWGACVECSPLQRRRVFQEAYERTYRRRILDAVAARRALPEHAPAGRPRAGFIFCIDEREESIRRAVEEEHPGYVTFGVAGFFGVAMDYLGLYDRHPAAQCPVAVIPAHEVHERPLDRELDWHERRQRLRARWQAWERRAGLASRTLSGGAGLSFLMGPGTAVRSAMQVFLPRRVTSVANRLKSHLVPRPATRLSAIRVEAGRPRPSAQPAHIHTTPLKPLGFSLDEAADRVTATLRNVGLLRDFAPIVVVLGHGSTSLNNPHESAHDCGACGGRRGGANARLFAAMANREDVRSAVGRRGVEIPPDVWFVGALHDTADDSITYYDLDTMPPSHGEVFDEVFAVLERARRENALERSRRFDDAPLDGTPASALAHVESRAAMLAQPRPEYGHCTNAIAIVGRRSVTRGLHLDRRAFLVSYDATTDPDASVIERILAAVAPVGAGISLEYYFSSVDNETFGCGTKLPHNVTGLVGVMNGHQSDLRTGLPWQMVEIHEPMRLLLIVEAVPDVLLQVASRQVEVAELVANAWVQLVSLDPRTGALQEFRDGRFVPYVPLPARLPVVDRSREWHMRTRAHLSPALVRRALPAAAGGLAESELALTGALHA